MATLSNLKLIDNLDVSDASTIDRELSTSLTHKESNPSPSSQESIQNSSNPESNAPTSELEVTRTISSPVYVRTQRTETHITPNGTREWFPHCSEDKKPCLGMVFENLEKAEKFYNDYAEYCGFESRSSSTYRNNTGVIALKYCVCSREGFLVPKIQKNTSERRRYKRSTKRIGCKARMILKNTGKSGTYSVFRFVEGHNHCLATPTSRQYLRSKRKMTIVHKNFISKNARVNIGPVKSFRLFKENVGSYENIGATMQDFRNFHKDLKEHIKGEDGSMLIENFIRKRDIFSGFYFDYALDEQNHICHLFWADAICRKNYALFGEMVSFDCTYDTNKYSMVLAAFTGVDHHKSCITFGIGLISKEDSDSFGWLFRTFLNAMGNCEPTYLITDQDPAMKIAIKDVFENTKHKLCMWHIMNKVTDKISKELKEDADFFKVLNACVWNMEQEPYEFENTWKALMEKYDLQHHSWFNHMYSIRDHWIPAYFKDLMLGGILRTTSRSESVNSFFNNFTNPYLTLVEFYMRFESAMDAQRYKQDKLNSDSLHTNPQFKTPLRLERHAADVYTRNIFYLFQNEVYKSCFKCGIVDIIKQGNTEIITITDSVFGKNHQVIFTAESLVAECSCKLFKRIGILCCHAICVLIARQVTQIPDYYILDRWTKDATKKPFSDMHGNIIEECRNQNAVTKLLGDVWSEIFNCVGLAEKSHEDLQLLLDNLKEFSCKLEERGAKAAMTKTQEMAIFVCPSASSTLDIQNPIQSKNKGKRHRIIGEKELNIEQRQKNKRKCRACGAYDYHDTRTCPTKISS